VAKKIGRNMKGQSPTVDSEVRRSPRVKEKNMGFKTNQ
jgi:hypothetical protein